jgi:PBP1b-binding outer membrane lipoprotein LpoB
MAEEKKDKKDFVVKDRRIFAEENQDTAEQSPPETDEKEPETKAAKQEQAPDTQEPPPPLPEMNFATFVASLNASALMQLGLIEDPISGTKNRNLPMAKQTIDILSMLQEKTEGNLSEEEANLLKNVLYDLRMMYVREKR